ncbi:stonustoxin subunit alpha-like [Xyrichtys novacula]|uniref:Stonustoxin subunit alpha-like n=1 Tax=Xyrichtys novacula TaxID=13765 RepID=A0AAV1FD61_XYRNO|nr:stonustoxin subunit alpha-like [Xyrichtys novacula]
MVGLLFSHLNPQSKPKTLRVEPSGVQWLKPGLRKYSCKLTVDSNTVNGRIKLSDTNREWTHVEACQAYDDHLDRFNTPQMLCTDGLTGRCYWEVEWRGRAAISVSYRGISRKDELNNEFGKNDQSWSLICCDGDEVDYSVWHENKVKPITRPSLSSLIRSIRSPSCTVTHRVAVYLDHDAGTLSFYRVSSDTLIHLHTVNTTFTKPLYPGFGFTSRHRFVPGSSVSLCSL